MSLMWFIFIYLICNHCELPRVSVGLAWLVFWTFVGTCCSVFYFYRNLLSLVERNSSLLLIRLSALLYIILISSLFDTLWEFQSRLCRLTAALMTLMMCSRSMQRHINTTLLIVGFLFLGSALFLWPHVLQLPPILHSPRGKWKGKSGLWTPAADCEVSLLDSSDFVPTSLKLQLQMYVFKDFSLFGRNQWACRRSIERPTHMLLVWGWTWDLLSLSRLIVVTRSDSE